MSTKHVILGLLDIMPMSGYDLSKNLKISLESLWAAGYSQIYPTLHKLEARGLVRGEEQDDGLKRQRILYTLTPAGREELHRWINEPVQYLPFRDPFKLWASYLDRVSPAVALKAIDRHIHLNEERAAYLEHIHAQITSGKHPLIKEREKRITADDLARLKATRALIFEELAVQARAEVESAQRIRRFFEQFYLGENELAAESAD